MLTMLASEQLKLLQAGTGYANLVGIRTAKASASWYRILLALLVSEQLKLLQAGTGYANLVGIRTAKAPASWYRVC